MRLLYQSTSRKVDTNVLVYKGAPLMRMRTCGYPRCRIGTGRFPMFVIQDTQIGVLDYNASRLYLL